MTFATEKEKAASNRFMLARVSGLKDYTSELVQVVGDIYKIVYDQKPEKIYIAYDLFTNDPPTRIEPSEVTTYPPTLNANEYDFDEANNTVYIRFYSTGISPVRRVFFEYYKYFTGEIYREAPKDPLVAGDNVTWSPYIENYPAVTTSIENLTVGIFSISSINLPIANVDNWIGEYTTQGATMYLQSVKIWLCINDVSNAKLLFTGETTAIEINGGIVNLSVQDSFNTLQKRADFGLLNTQTFANSEIDGSLVVVNFAPNALGKTIPRHFQRRTNYDFGVLVGTVGDTSAFNVGLYNEFTISPAPTVKGYRCGRVKTGLSSSNDISMQSIGAISSTTALSIFVREFQVASHANLFYGQTVTWTEGLNTWHGIIAEIVSPTIFRVFRIAADTASTSSTFTLRKAFSAYIRSGNDTINLIQGRDYTLSVSGGDVSIALVTGFESNFTQFTSNPFDAYKDQLYYYYYNTADLGHATIIKNLVEASGLATNSASFTAAAAALTANVSFSIPSKGSDQIETYADYIAKILESTGGYLRVNEDNEVEYHLFEAPSPSLTIDSSEYSDFTHSIEFQDIYPVIEATNPEYQDNQLDSSSSAAATPRRFVGYDADGAALNNIKRVKYLKHVLTSMDNSIDRVVKLNSIRRYKYSFNASPRFLDVLLGDDIRIYNEKLPGGAAYVDAKIISKTVDAKTVRIEAIDLPNF